MRKFSYLIIVFFIAFNLSAQGKYATKSGSITFEASVPSFEPVAAKHSNVSALLNAKTGEFAVLALVNGFHFEIALMEEHFNENYMESSSFPKAIFKGKIDNYQWENINNDSNSFVLVGTITIHGVTKPFETQVNIKKASQDTLELDTQFILNPEDFDINIPKIVRNKIAKEVILTAAFELKVKE